MTKQSIVLIFLLQCLTNTFSQTGELDITFGSNGKVVTPINGSNSTIYSIALRPNGKIVAGGKSIIGGVDQFTIVQYNADGSIDTNFGTYGRVVTQIGDKSVINSLAIQQDGKIVAGGSSRRNVPFIIAYFTLARYNINGKIDSSFGINGLVETEMSGELTEIKKVLIKSNGKILAGGKVTLMTFEDIPAIVQYNTNGSVDSTFATNGKFENYVGTVQKVSDMIFTTDEKILVTGDAKTNIQLPNDFDFAIFRFLSNGTFDNSFGNNGFTFTDFSNSSDVPVSLHFRMDSTIIVSGYSISWNPSITKFATACFSINGTPISAFGSNGKVTTVINGNTAVARAMAITADDNIVVSGNTFYTTEDFALVKYLKDGSLDNVFGSSGNGVVTTDFLSYKDESFCSVIQPNGKIIVAGHANDNSIYNFALARYNYQLFPLRLLSFSAKRNESNIVLYWTTSDEINVSRFEMEHSNNGTEFRTVATIQSGKSSYNYIDSRPAPKTNFYRLKIVDKDGKFEYGPVRFIKNNKDEVIACFPNPVVSILQVQIQNVQSKKFQLQVLSTIGNQVMATNLDELNINQYKSIDVSCLPKGIYFLKVLYQNKKFSITKFEKL